ncbi:hypothetical protein NDU88_002270 [Pleurodeles waltl]|uniref:Uncharacterized protein n=1 Tax=Pleurodeles waltl TaxID=8319 RepID=A0AAV7WPT5_PLEWA|nr:hypothetical protein NDU88_002270 [Pleurodeles waltl]
MLIRGRRSQNSTTPGIGHTHVTNLKTNRTPGPATPNRYRISSVVSRLRKLKDSGELCQFGQQCSLDRNQKVSLDRCCEDKFVGSGLVNSSPVLRLVKQEMSKQSFIGSNQPTAGDVLRTTSTDSNPCAHVNAWNISIYQAPECECWNTNVTEIPGLQHARNIITLCTLLAL